MSTGLVIDLFGGIRGTIAAGVAVLALAAAGVLGVLWQLAAAEREVCDANTDVYQQAQAANGRMIDDLRSQLAEVVDKQKADLDAADKAADEMAALKAEAERKLAAKESELEALYARSPSARTWARTGVDRDVVDRLPRPR